MAIITTLSALPIAVTPSTESKTMEPGICAKTLTAETDVTTHPKSAVFNRPVFNRSQYGRKPTKRFSPKARAQRPLISLQKRTVKPSPAKLTVMQFSSSKGTQARTFHGRLVKKIKLILSSYIKSGRKGRASTKGKKIGVRRFKKLKRLNPNRRRSFKMDNRLEKKPREAAVLKQVFRLNKDGDRLPETETVNQARDMISKVKELPFALEKIIYHMKNDQLLLDRRSIRSKLKTAAPDEIETLSAQEFQISGAIGGYFRELNKIYLENYMAVVIRLITTSNYDPTLRERLTASINKCPTLSVKLCIEEMQNLIALLKDQKKSPTHP